MVYRTGNVYYAVVINAPVLVYLIRIQIKTKQTRFQPYVFMFTVMYNALLLMAYSQMNNEQYVLGVPIILLIYHLEKYTHKRSLSYLKL